MGRWLCPTATSTLVALGLRAKLDVFASESWAGCRLYQCDRDVDADVRLQRKSGRGYTWQRYRSTTNEEKH
jgi:hypothetical protein